ncbi:MAG: choloylglycine hydrolase family protein [Ruminococcaceae bacterium]|nr:choloylglycine hydrolase family protein [Oscillospiraceae bacterium]
MCTAISFLHYFGRNLDLDRDYGQQVTVAPRYLPLSAMKNHSAIIGMATAVEGYPLFFEGTNEEGLSVAALNFPGNAVYHPPRPDKVNIASYDFISYVLTRCKTCAEAKGLLENANVCDDRFSDDLPTTPLHWLIADRNMALVAESTEAGLQLYESPIKVLTNNPPFPYHRDNLCRYMGLSSRQPENRLAPSLSLAPFSLGMGAAGLPGDFSSPSRFVRSAFVLHNSPQDTDAPLSQFLRILEAAAIPEGCVKTENGHQKTIYSCCCDTVRGIYYYVSANNHQIRGVDMHRVDLDSDKIICFPHNDTEQILWLNK